MDFEVNLMEKRQMREELKYLIEFTKIYRSETDKYIREAKCLDCQIRKILVPMTKEEKIFIHTSFTTSRWKK